MIFLTKRWDDSGFGLIGENVKKVSIKEGLL